MRKHLNFSLASKTPITNYSNKFNSLTPFNLTIDYFHSPENGKLYLFGEQGAPNKRIKVFSSDMLSLLLIKSFNMLRSLLQML